MQQELIEMLEEIIQYVEIWNAHDQGIIDKAEALVEKAKNCAKESAVPQGFATLNEWFLSLPEQRQVQLRDDKWMLANAAFMANRTAAPSQPVTLTEEVLEPIVKVIFDSGWSACRDSELVGDNAKEFAWDMSGDEITERTSRAIIAALRGKEAKATP